MSGAEGGAFSRRGARWLAGVAAVSLGISGVLAVFPDAFDGVVSAGADGFSRSAIGHHAFLTLLRELGFPVASSRHETGARAGTSVVVVAEPDVGELEVRREKLEGIASEATRLLVVLPKRVGMPPNPSAPWITVGGVVPLPAAQAVLDAVLEGARVVRPSATVTWRGSLPAPGAIDGPQLVVSEKLTPLVSAEGADAGAMLAGELVEDGFHLVVLADPDVLETHGLGDGDAALLAVRLVERLGAAPGGAPVLVDETLHGHEATPSVARELFRWPLVVATAHAAALLALLAWAALVRFGRPLRVPAGLAAGKAFLIDNTAELLRYGGHTAPVLHAYWRATKDAIAHALRAPGERADTDRWLARVAAARGLGAELARLDRAVAGIPPRRAEAEAVRAAVDVHRFRKELTDGAGSDPERR